MCTTLFWWSQLSDHPDSRVAGICLPSWWDDLQNYSTWGSLDWTASPAKFVCWSPNPWSDSVWRWGLWSYWVWMRSWGLSAHMRGLVPSWQETRESCLSLCLGRTQHRGSRQQRRKWALTRSQPRRHPDLRCVAFRSVWFVLLLGKGWRRLQLYIQVSHSLSHFQQNEFLVFKPHSL